MIFLKLVYHLCYINKTLPLWTKLSKQHFEIKIISPRDFGAFQNYQSFGSARIYGLWFIDKNSDLVISWDKNMLSTFTRKSAWQKNEWLCHFLISADINRNDFWFVIYKWIKQRGIIRWHLFQAVFMAWELFWKNWGPDWVKAMFFYIQNLKHFKHSLRDKQNLSYSWQWIKKHYWF